MKYYANFNANNGTSWINSMEDTNKARLIKSVRSTAEGERFVGSTCRWWVCDENGTYVAYGGMSPSGKRFRYSEEDCRSFLTDVF